MAITIKFSAQRRDDRLAVSVSGDVLTLNDHELDLTEIPEGATLPASAVASDWVVDEITRSGGMLVVTLVLPHGPDAPNETLYPAPIIVTADGAVDLPAWEIDDAALDAEESEG